MQLRLVTSNPGKVRELAAALAPHPVTQARRDYPEVQAATLAEVVAFGLEWLAREAPGETPGETPGVALVIDDAGLFIDALGGFPGVYSHYVYDTLGLAGVLKLMEGVAHRQATFRCVLGLLLPDGARHLFHGACGGTIAPERRGAGGFGYDSLFIPDGSHRTFAELPLAAKNRLSHRGGAVAALAEWLEREFGDDGLSDEQYIK